MTSTQQLRQLILSHPMSTVFDSKRIESSSESELKDLYTKIQAATLKIHGFEVGNKVMHKEDEDKLGVVVEPQLTDAYYEVRIEDSIGDHILMLNDEIETWYE